MPAASSARRIDPEAAYRALAARDARFDGRWFVGVSSTGIYCRPICRVRTPRRENCRFFASAAEAEAAAYRPCLKCRPEIAPGAGLPWSVMDASATLARQAAQWLAAHAFDGDAGDDAGAASPASLARHLGISERHLRRIFTAAHGVSPLQFLRTRRLLHAKQLLTDTRWPVTRIAHASGFRSLRRFNAAFVESYRLSPSALRRIRAADPGVANGAFQATLAYREPLARAALLRFLQRRALPGVEAVTLEPPALRRTLRAAALGCCHEPGWIALEFSADRPQLVVRASDSLAAASGRLLAAVRRCFDLDAEPQAIAAALRGLEGAVPGLRLPGGIDAFELGVRAILGQQVTVAAARTFARRLVLRYGAAVATPWSDLAQCFPAPETLAAAGAQALGELGILRRRAEAIVALASGWSELAPLLQAGADPAVLVERLRRLPGVGAWTAHYIAMRALAWSDAFPPGDAAALSALGLGRGARATADAEAWAQAWRPWRAYALLALWNRMEES